MADRIYLKITFLAAITLVAVIFTFSYTSELQRGLHLNLTGAAEMSPNTPIVPFQNISAPSSCPLAGGPIFNTVFVNFSGFENYTLSANGSNYANLVIAPGKIGIVNYKIVRSNDYYQVINSSGVVRTVTNTTPINIKNIITIGILSANTNIQTIDQAGLRAYLLPATENVPSESSVNIKFILNSSGTATPNTYYINLGPSFCGGGVSFLLTIGNLQYSGPLPHMNLPA